MTSFTAKAAVKLFSWAPIWMTCRWRSATRSSAWRNSRAHLGNKKPLFPHREEGLVFCDGALLAHHVLEHPDDDHQDRAADAAARHLTEHCAPIGRAGGLRERRHQCLQDLAANAAADDPGDRVAERAEAVVLQSRA